MNLSRSQYCCTVADFLSLCEPNVCGGYLRDCFASRKEIYLYEFTELNFCLLAVRTLNIFID